ncbi:MAG TPA: arsenite methyltransferase [Bacteroidetes bacterium]|nr:arsenite methyltransferase [Bacteroidota bacterium]
MKTRKKNMKDIVKSKYNLIAKQTKEQNESSCCGSTGCCDSVDYTIFSDDYSHLDGYNADADLGLGCGLPTEHANISTGDTILDLGSGAGNDCFVARSIVGKTGKVIGIDFAANMLKKARRNAQKLGYENVEFIKGDIEDMPIADASVDVVVSNCVLNLVPDKAKAFDHIYRVLKPSGHFCVSDVVLQGELPDEFITDAEMYAGCVSGAIQKNDYLDIIKTSGFKGITIKKEKEVIIPDEILANYLDEQGMQDYKSRELGIYSITVYANKGAVD